MKLLNGRCRLAADSIDEATARSKRRECPLRSLPYQEGPTAARKECGEGGNIEYRTRNVQGRSEKDRQRTQASLSLCASCGFLRVLRGLRGESFFSRLSTLRGLGMMRPAGSGGTASLAPGYSLWPLRGKEPIALRHEPFFPLPLCPFVPSSWWGRHSCLPVIVVHDHGERAARSPSESAERSPLSSLMKRAHCPQVGPG